MKSAILITGAAGAIGSCVARRLLREGCHVVVVDVLNDETSTPVEKQRTIGNLQEEAVKHAARLDFHLGDIVDAQVSADVLNRYSPSVVVHAAARVQDRASVRDPQAFIQCNVVGTSRLLEEIKKADCVEHVVLLSSRSAVGEAFLADRPMSETDSLLPINPYGATKAAAEHLCHSFHVNTGVPVTVLRLNPQISSRSDMMPRRVLEALHFGRQIVQFGTGESSRDWLSVDDTADAVWCALARPATFNVFLLGTGRATTLNQLIASAEKTVGRRSIVRSVPHPPGDATHGGIANASLAREKLGWRPVRSVEQALEELYARLKEYHFAG